MKSYRTIFRVGGAFCAFISKSCFSSLALTVGIALCATTAEADQTWTGKVEITSDVNDYLYIATAGDAAVYQDGHVVSNELSYGWLGNNEYSAAYILEDGVFTGDQYLQADGRYLHFRQTGGTARFYGMRRTKTTLNTLPFDLVFGGSAYAYLPFYSTDGALFRNCHMNIAVMDDADVDLGLLRADGTGTNYVHIIALNGGKLTMSNRPGGRNVHYAFNGGTLTTSTWGTGWISGPNMFGDNRGSASGFDAWVRVYENGGRIIHRVMGTGNNDYLDPVQILKPKDNVVLSVPIPNGHALKTRVWDTPPSVVIVDSTGAGSNAVAVADWDFYSGHVTNITVLSRGENYSACSAEDENPTVKAKFRLSVTDDMDDDPTLHVPVVTGPGQSGDFTFAHNGAGWGIRVRYATNTYCGATIVDMDMTGAYEHKEDGAPSYFEYRNSLMVQNAGSTRFLNTTSIVIRSGAIWPSLSPNTHFPSATRLELYGGHITTQTYTFPDVVVGGETWLSAYKTTSYLAALSIPADGTLAVDYGAVVTNGVIVQPKLKYGTVTLNSGAKIMVKDWEKLPRGKKVPVLDLSGVTTFTTKANATLVQGDEGDIFWGEGDDDANILYARRRADGFFMIFK